jgi:hypothetical protein
VSLVWLRLLASTTLGIAATFPLRAAELNAFNGQLRYDGTAPDTYIWGIEYREAIDDHLSGSLAWLNEGHVTGHHRDGQALQLWWHTLPGSTGLVFEGGLGPYVDYDTLHPETGYVDRHGVAGLASVAADWYLSSRWLLFLRLNRVVANTNFNTTSAAVGFGYHFTNAAAAPSSGAGADPASPVARWEFTAYLGSTVQNASHGATAAIEARRQLTDHFAATADFITCDSDIGLGWHRALEVQIWAQQQLTRRFSVGAGAGLIVVGDDFGVSYYGSPHNPAAAASVGFAYALTHSWDARATWTRIGTNDNKDADLFLLGVGRRF